MWPLFSIIPQDNLAQPEGTMDHWPPSLLIASAMPFLLSVIPPSVPSEKVLLLFLFAYFVVSAFLITHENE